MVDPVTTTPSAAVGAGAPGAPTPAPAAGFADALRATLAAGTGTSTAPPTSSGRPSLVTFGEMVAFRGQGAAPLAAAPVVQPAWAGLLGATAATAPGLMAATAPGLIAAEAPATGGGALVMPVQGRVSSRFGPRVHPVSGKHHSHSGLDIAAPTGTPIAAAAGGTVTFAGVRGGYGNLVIIDHGDGRETRYAHADRLLVQPGQRVGAGEAVATVGATGTATGPHLHLEVRVNGTAVDPAPLLRP